LNVLTFMRWQSVAHATRTQIEPLISVIQAFGEMEGFPAHAFDAVIRQ
jgi:histidinol dehydrogenase